MSSWEREIEGLREGKENIILYTRCAKNLDLDVDKSLKHDLLFQAASLPADWVRGLGLPCLHGSWRLCHEGWRFPHRPASVPPRPLEPNKIRLESRRQASLTAKETSFFPPLSTARVLLIF